VVDSEELELVGGGGGGAAEEEARREGVRRRRGCGGGVDGGADVVDQARGYTDMDVSERDDCERCMRCTGLGFLSCMACSD
jgi:hypothetical protein